MTTASMRCRRTAAPLVIALSVSPLAIPVHAGMMTTGGEAALPVGTVRPTTACMTDPTPHTAGGSVASSGPDGSVRAAAPRPRTSAELCGEPGAYITTGPFNLTSSRQTSYLCFSVPSRICLAS